MTKHTQDADPSESGATSRRAFLLLLPISVIAGAVGSVATAAFRFLRPAPPKPSKWSDVGAVSALAGDKPIMRSVKVEQDAGWATTMEDRLVYVLPGPDGQVLSAICPHEGCEVMWREDANAFSCPCHDSNFAPDGTLVEGPARRGLDPLPARVENGILQVQYQRFENDTKERVIRA